MKTINAATEAVGGLLVLAGIVAVAVGFRTGVLLEGGHLANLWAVPVAFLAAALLLDKAERGGTAVPAWVAAVLSYLAGGTWLGLSFVALVVLSGWYADPGDPRAEPLFVAVGLSGAGVLVAQRWYGGLLDRIRGRAAGDATPGRPRRKRACSLRGARVLVPRRRRRRERG